MSKRCTKCRKVKALSLFNLQKRGKFGRYSVCKDCRSNDWKKWYRLNSDKRKIYKKKYNSVNLEMIRRYARNYYRKNSSLANGRWKRYAGERRDALRLYYSFIYLVDREKIRSSRRWENLPKEMTERALRRHKKWVSENTEIASGYGRTRRARVKSVPICDLTAGQWVLIKSAFLFLCAYCGLQKPLTQDHVIPISRGGSHTASNVVPACRSCNSKKKDRSNFKMTSFAEFIFHLTAGA